MTDQPDDQPSIAADGGPADETPAQKALRLKQAKIAAKPQPPRGGKFQREQGPNRRRQVQAMDDALGG